MDRNSLLYSGSFRALSARHRECMLCNSCLVSRHTTHRHCSYYSATTQHGSCPCQRSEQGNPIMKTRHIFRCERMDKGSPVNSPVLCRSLPRPKPCSHNSVSPSPFHVNIRLEVLTEPLKSSSCKRNQDIATGLGTAWVCSCDCNIRMQAWNVSGLQEHLFALLVCS